jgi:hypothetical protein
VPGHDYMARPRRKLSVNSLFRQKQKRASRRASSTNSCTGAGFLCASAADAATRTDCSGILQKIGVVATSALGPCVGHLEHETLTAGHFMAEEAPGDVVDAVRALVKR